MVELWGLDDGGSAKGLRLPFGTCPLGLSGINLDFFLAEAARFVVLAHVARLGTAVWPLEVLVAWEGFRRAE